MYVLPPPSLTSPPTPSATDAHVRSQFGGGLHSDGTLKLVRPTFTDSTCSGAKPCGSGCFCDGADASKCVGCACRKDSSNPGFTFFYCDSK